MTKKNKRGGEPAEEDKTTEVQIGKSKEQSESPDRKAQRLEEEIQREAAAGSTAEGEAGTEEESAASQEISASQENKIQCAICETEYTMQGFGGHIRHCRRKNPERVLALAEIGPKDSGEVGSKEWLDIWHKSENA